MLTRSSVMLSMAVALLTVSTAVATPQLDIQLGQRMYRGYQVLRCYPTNQQQKTALLLIEDEVDFWSELGSQSGHLDMMVAPDKLEKIHLYLNLNSIYHEVLISDVEEEIEQENDIDDSDLTDEEIESLIYSLPEKERSKRQNSDQSELSFFSIFDLSRYLPNPANERRRRKPQDSGERKPRKFSNSSPPSVNAPISSFAEKPRNESRKETCARTGMNWKQYQPFSVINRWLECLERNYKQKVELITIGKSYEGRPLRVARVHSGVENKQQAVFVDGGIHAREWVSPASVSYILHKLVETSDLDHILQKFDVYILPVANPDGYEYSRNHDRMWRKTRSKTGARNFLGQECFGVDPNRNFGWNWGGHGASKNECKETYMGRTSFSEPETRAIRDFLLSGRNFQLYLTFHSYGQYILYPWGYDTVDAVDKADLHRVGSRAANVLNSKYGSAYEVGSAAKLLYPASGGSDDWAKGGAGIKYSFTVELPDTGKHGFILPARFIKGVGTEAATCLDTMLNQI